MHSFSAHVRNVVFFPLFLLCVYVCALGFQVIFWWLLVYFLMLWCVYFSCHVYVWLVIYCYMGVFLFFSSVEVTILQGACVTVCS